MVDRLEDRSLLATLHVDDSFSVDDPNHHKFMTIQAAVAAATAGDTIRVAPGTYEEAVTVSKQLSIVAERPANRNDSGHHNGDDNGKHNGDDNGKHKGQQRGSAIVEIPAGGSFGFNLTANDIVLRGFLIEDSDDNGNAAGADGIVTSGATSGDQILNNIIVGTTMGIYLNSNGTHRTTVSGNLFDSNKQAGAAAGNGIYSDAGLSNVQIVNNVFTGHTNASIILVGSGALAQSNVTIRQNVMRDDAPVILANTTHAEVSRNVSTNSVGSGIFLAGGSSDVTIKQNVLTGGAFTGINLRFDPANYNVTTVNTNIRVLDNVISGFGDAGIRLRDGTNHVTVQNNRVLHNGSLGGISLEDADDNTVQNNTASNNSGDGIHLDSLSTGNVISNNTAQNNTGFDLHDESMGTGTAGTANTWTKNKARTRSPVGLG